MRETFDGRVVSCVTRVFDFVDEDGEAKEREESSVAFKFDADEYDGGVDEYFTIRSPRYKGLSDLVGKEARIVVEVEE